VNGVTQRTKQISANRAAKLDKFQSQCYSKCSKWRPLISRQQCYVCVTDRQRRRSLSLKPVKASSVIGTLGANRLK